MRGLLLFAALFVSTKGHMVLSSAPRCRVQPGQPGFPSPTEWQKLNATIGGRLVAGIPSAQFCHDLPEGNCTFEEWSSSNFMMRNPGTMLCTNWEQDYRSIPPSLCLQNGTECGQGLVPVFAINASSAADIQAGVRFASAHNLKLSVKSSGHDYLGRSTAKGSLLLWTQYLRNVSFTDHFRVGNKDLGSAVTVGSGIAVNELYVRAKAEGKMLVTGVAATVHAAGGYVQGAGHSAFSPLLGLAADNVLEFSIVTADGRLVTANEASHPDLFWALRGGGAGSWGVILSATFRTVPTFNATQHTAIYYFPTKSNATSFAQLHAKHIFDWDTHHAGQYFFLVVLTDPLPGYAMLMITYFPNANASDATSAMAPLMDEALAGGFTLVESNFTEGIVNDLVTQADSDAGVNTILCSRLIPERVYRERIEEIGKTYDALLDAGAPSILGHLVAGGKVSQNAIIKSAVNPKWRTAKVHLVISTSYSDNTTLPEIESIKQNVTNNWVPKLAALTGEPDSGAYSNEADVRESNFQTTFFGRNYRELSRVKRRYDPDGMFIVGAGVGSEEWDEYGICRKG